MQIPLWNILNWKKHVARWRYVHLVNFIYIHFFVGGAAVTEEVVPGYKFSRASYVLSLLRNWGVMYSAHDDCYSSCILVNHYTTGDYHPPCSLHMYCSWLPWLVHFIAADWLMQYNSSCTLLLTPVMYGGDFAPWTVSHRLPWIYTYIIWNTDLHLNYIIQIFI